MSRNLYFVAAYDPFVATCDLSGVRKLVKEPTGATRKGWWQGRSRSNGPCCDKGTFPHITPQNIQLVCGRKKKERRERRRKVLELPKISQSSATCLRQVQVNLIMLDSPLSLFCYEISFRHKFWSSRFVKICSLDAQVISMLRSRHRTQNSNVR